MHESEQDTSDDKKYINFTIEMNRLAENIRDQEIAAPSIANQQDCSQNEADQFMDKVIKQRSIVISKYLLIKNNITDLCHLLESPKTKAEKLVVSNATKGRSSVEKIKKVTEITSRASADVIEDINHLYSYKNIYMVL